MASASAAHVVKVLWRFFNSTRRREASSSVRERQVRGRRGRFSCPVPGGGTSLSMSDLAERGSATRSGVVTHSPAALAWPPYAAGSPLARSFSKNDHLGPKLPITGGSWVGAGGSLRCTDCPWVGATARCAVPIARRAVRSARRSVNNAGRSVGKARQSEHIVRIVRLRFRLAPQV
jgi:hypothetical protein